MAGNARARAARLKVWQGAALYVFAVALDLAALVLGAAGLCLFAAAAGVLAWGLWHAATGGGVL